MNGSRPMGADASTRTSAGDPSAHIADCHFTRPTTAYSPGLALITATACSSTYRRGRRSRPAAMIVRDRGGQLAVDEHTRPLLSSEQRAPSRSSSY